MTYILNHTHPTSSPLSFCPLLTSTMLKQVDVSGALASGNSHSSCPSGCFPALDLWSLSRSHTSLSLLAEVEFNVSEAFVPLTTPNSNHSSHTGNESDSGTLERKRPASMAVMEGDLVKKESPPKPKDSAAAPAPGRASSQVAGGPTQAQMAAGSHQLSVGPAHGSTGSSPHTLRRGE